MSRVLFVCLHNAGRSQMSQAWFEQLAGSGHEARSAGTEPAAHIDPNVVTVMREAGIDVAGREPQRLTDELSSWADVVITMGCGDACPVIPGKRYFNWELPDPKDLRLDEVRAVRDDIRVRVTDLVKDLHRATARR